MPHPSSPPKSFVFVSKGAFFRFVGCVLIAAPLLLGGATAQADAEADAQAESYARQEAKIVKETERRMSEHTSKRLDRAVRHQTSNLMLDVRLEANARAAMRATLAKRVEDQLRRAEAKQTDVAKR